MLPAAALHLTFVAAATNTNGNKEYKRAPKTLLLFLHDHNLAR